jgi:hypothetical protein
MDNKILQLAFSIYHNQGIYALLLGSGISRSAGIPTGWEVVSDLITKLAYAGGETTIANPFEWYIKKYDEEPVYDKLVEKLGVTSFERNALLLPYFEPTEDEREQGLKLPSKAHKAIAALIKDGYIRVILTTNFDRLLELALQNEGITPDVISTTDMLIGSRPIQHSPITIVKLHGDYRDGRIKNTPDELAQYDDVWNRLVDRILEEYGLIVCGWSGEWDTALKSAILRCPTQRYSTFWAAYGNLHDEAQRLIQHRRAEVIAISGADDFFTNLTQSVMAFATLNRGHPMTVSVMVEQVKRLLPNSQRQIELEELIQEQGESVYQRIISEEFYSYLLRQIPKGLQTFEDFAHYTDLYFAEGKLFLNIITTTCWYGEGKFRHQITDTLRRWIDIPSPSNESPLAYIPILLLMYTVGIASVKRESWIYLQSIFFEPVIPRRLTNGVKDMSFLDFLRSRALLPLVGNSANTAPAQMNLTLHGCLRPLFEKLIPAADQYSEAFDLFEMLLSLAYLRTTKEDKNGEWMPPHLVCFKTRSWDYLEAFWERAGKQKEQWGLLDIEPFIATPAEFEKSLGEYVKVAHLFQESRRFYLSKNLPNYAEIYHKATGKGNARGSSGATNYI